jgi:hypothetical protein
MSCLKALAFIATHVRHEWLRIARLRANLVSGGFRRALTLAIVSRVRPTIRSDC